MDRVADIKLESEGFYNLSGLSCSPDCEKQKEVAHIVGKLWRLKCTGSEREIRLEEHGSAAFQSIPSGTGRPMESGQMLFQSAIAKRRECFLKIQETNT